MLASWFYCYVMFTGLILSLWQEDPLYSHYQRLHCELSPVEADSEEFSMVMIVFQFACQVF